MTCSSFRKSSYLTTLILAFTVGFMQLGLAQNGLTPTQVAKIKNVGSVYLSADGSTAAYTLSVPADPMKENALPSTHLYMMDVSSGETSPLITDMSVSGIAFRPGSTNITYLAKKEEDETTSLYELNTESGESRSCIPLNVILPDTAGLLMVITSYSGLQNLKMKASRRSLTARKFMKRI